MPDNILGAAESLASILGISRNELFTRAVVEFIEVEKYKNVTAQLNRVYSKSQSTLLPNLAAMQYEVISNQSCGRDDAW